MRVVLPLLLFCLLTRLSLAGQTSAELAEQLLQRLASEEAAALQQTPPADDRARVLHSAAEILHQHWEGGQKIRLWRRDDGVLVRLQGLLANFPELVKLAEEWNNVRKTEDADWESGARPEILKVGGEVVEKLRAAKAPEDVDQAIARLTMLATKYPSNFGAAGVTPDTMECLRGIVSLRKIAVNLQALLMAERDGRRQDIDANLSKLFGSEASPLLVASELRALCNQFAHQFGVPSMDEADDAVRAVIGKAIAANEAAELDPLREQMIRVQRLWEEAGVRDREARSPVRVAVVGREFVVKWQDMLAALANGDVASAQATVDALVRTAESEPVYPRGKLLEISASLKAKAVTKPMTPKPMEVSIPPEAETLLVQLKTLDDLAAKLPELKVALEKTRGENRTIITELERIHTANVNLRAGDLNAADLAIFHGANKHPKVVELRVQLAARLAGTVLHGAGASAPREDEKPDEYIARMVADARQRKDWPRVQEIHEIVLQHHGFSGILQPNDAFALRSFLSARNLDAAGVWSSAVTSYIQALKTGSTILPADEISQRIEAIRRTHPEDYKRGSGQLAGASSAAPVGGEMAVWPWVIGVAVLFIFAAAELKRRF